MSEGLPEMNNRLLTEKEIQDTGTMGLVSQEDFVKYPWRMEARPEHYSLIEAQDAKTARIKDEEIAKLKSDLDAERTEHQKQIREIVKQTKALAVDVMENPECWDLDLLNVFMENPECWDLDQLNVFMSKFKAKYLKEEPEK